MTNSREPSTPPPSSALQTSFTLDLPRESRRSFLARRVVRDEAGSGYELRAGALEVLSEDGESMGTAVRMNATYIWFEPVRKKRIPYGETVPVLLKVAYGTLGPFSARVGIEALDDDVYSMAVLQNVPLSSGREIVKFMNLAATQDLAQPTRPKVAVQTDLVDPVRIRVVVESFAHRQAQASISSGGTVIQARLVAIDDNSRQLIWVPEEDEPPLRFDGDIVIEVAGYNCVYELHFKHAHQTMVGIRTGFPERMAYNRYRRYRRAPLSEATLVRFSHPLWPELPVIERSLTDLSFGGIAFPADPWKDALYIGLRIGPIEVLAEGGPILLRGTVRSLVPSPTGGIMCGLSVEAWEPQHAASWATFVMQILNETTVAGDDRADALWELYTESGYFNLSGKGPHEFDSLSKSFRSVCDRTRLVPWLSYQSVWPSGRRIEASVSTVKLYSGAWMLHQLAKRKANQKEPRARHILRDTYLRAFEYMQTDPTCNWVISYAEAHVKWVKRSHIAFAEHFEATGAALARPFRLMEANCRERAEVTPLGIYRIAAAAPDEQQLALDALRATHPPAYLEAMDLVPGRFDLAMIKRLWSDAGLERDREVWVARRGSTPIATAILEVGETGTNLFRLTDSVRLVSLQPGGEAAFLPLLDKARLWYLARGKDSFVYIREHDDEHHVVAGQLRDLGEGRVWVIRSDLIPDFLELVCELNAHSDHANLGRVEAAVPGPLSTRHPRLELPRA